MRIFASRQCADYAHASYAGSGEARVARVTFAGGVASCLGCDLSESSVSECVRLCDAHMAYT